MAYLLIFMRLKQAAFSVCYVLKIALKILSLFPNTKARKYTA